MNISFIGFGNLGKAIARGLTQQNHYAIYASAPSLAKGITPDGIITDSDNIWCAQQSNIIILAVKPKLMQTVLDEIRPFIAKDTLLISLAAGLTLDWFKQHTQPEQAVIRTIPNTPASIGLSATPLIANSHVSELQKQAAETIFKSIGITTWAHREDDMNAFTALSASGPAYVFLFIQSLIDAAVDLGLEAAIAKTFALQMVKGATELAAHSELSLQELTTRVATPGGTTAAALNVLNNSMEVLIQKALHAAANRARELGQ